MIETHVHILAGIDDGPETMEGSIALARALVQEGVHSAAATPHDNDEFHRYTVGEIQHWVSNVQQELDHNGFPFRLSAGHEALIKPELVEDFQAGQLAALNGSRYLLLELWNNTWLPETKRVIFELRAFGIIPVITHSDAHSPAKRPLATKQTLEIATQLLGLAEAQQLREVRPTAIVQNAEVNIASTWQFRQERRM